MHRLNLHGQAEMLITDKVLAGGEIMSRIGNEIMIDAKDLA
jgi:hypothetical protein